MRIFKVDLVKLGIEKEKPIDAINESAGKMITDGGDQMVNAN